ncbi:macrophage migration inhibitory factor (MIF) domain-containing protein [Ditylenchus destructor]|uniref:Macrophage migration inhibitory factor (MIF) domain-containing protein n=1 Tax=Ditylenchus destructor TaxID=166010 RepID=A0AAD4MKF6_9BILA|nr:macrophage migration inhibitory factor (MIF) domain-containing protein [Ditylenchus destructor]
MPIVTLTTNIPKSKFPPDFRIEFVKLCEETLKRKGLINFLLAAGADFTFGTLDQHEKKEDVVIVDVEACINYTEAENAWAVELMTEFLTVTLDVPAERVIVVFKELQPQNVGRGGEWIGQVNLKRFEPIGTAAKKRMKDAFKDDEKFKNHLRDITLNNGMLDGLKERMSLERFDDRTFFRILAALVSVPKFREENNISESLSGLNEFQLDIVR